MEAVPLAKEVPSEEPVSLAAPADGEAIEYPGPASGHEKSLPSLELEAAKTELYGSAGEMQSAIDEISRHLKDSGVEMMLKEILYSHESLNATAREILEELKASRKNQEELLKLLKKSKEEPGKFRKSLGRL